MHISKILGYSLIVMILSGCTPGTYVNGTFIPDNNTYGPIYTPPPPPVYVPYGPYVPPRPPVPPVPPYGPIGPHGLPPVPPPPPPVGPPVPPPPPPPPRPPHVIAPNAVPPAVILPKKDKKK